MAKKQKLPPVHPGEVLREDYLIPAGVTVNALALALRVPVSRIYQIVKCTRSITPETALRLARHLGTSPEFWLGLQSDYDLEKAQEEFEGRIEREVQPRDRAA
jgi:addiction module HigA family antidote